MTSQRIIVQYILLRKDLGKLPTFRSKGSIVAQACHASTAALAKSFSSPTTQAYVAELDQMTKMVLAVPDEASLLAASKAMEEKGIPHALWLERPENIYTALAIYPAYKDEVDSFFKQFKLY